VVGRNRTLLEVSLDTTYMHDRPSIASSSPTCADHAPRRQFLKVSRANAVASASATHGGNASGRSQWVFHIASSPTTAREASTDEPRLRIDLEHLHRCRVARPHLPEDLKHRNGFVYVSGQSGASPSTLASPTWRLQSDG
jgi:hypothetical protein